MVGGDERERSRRRISKRLKWGVGLLEVVVRLGGVVVGGGTAGWSVVVGGGEVWFGARS
jgi:hypothetical protein